MNSKLLFALLGFAGLASLGRAAVVVVDPLCRREVVARATYQGPAGRVVWVLAEPCRPRYGRYERVVQVRRDGCRDVRYVYMADGRRRYRG